ncbi:MAG: Holliday junction resolvase RuvX [Tissierellia bacterium]|nr:Holliday junction resolvase RuvX [Tissierellia bacterium]
MENRILGLDIGDVRIGVAISDPMNLFAQPLKTIIHKSKWEDVEEIRNIIEEYKINKVIIGLPKNMNNTIGSQGKKVQKFARALQHNYPIEVVFFDERLTSVSAERALIEGNMRRNDRKNVIDQIAASLILQMYLDRK